jgi:arylsulfatase A-like enzyme
MPVPFKGTINLDIRDSKPDWEAFLDRKAPKDAPNVLVILYDDTGQAAWSPYGGRINMPTMDRLAKDGLTYTQWHTTSVCSPTRSCFLTGRNHHQNGFGTIAESAAGFPGYAGHIPPENATIATILRNAGWSTFWIGKNHNVPVDAFDIGANRKHWPLGLGYDRFYGFIGGETNQWYPELIADNHFVEPPYSPEEGYHFSKDIADKAIGFIRDTKQARADKPWYLWYCPGANHAPHHAPKEYIDKYKGKFDDGYEAYREWVLARMTERGIMPKDTELTPINPMSKGTFIEADSVRPWNTLNADEKKLFSRMAEVYAAFSEYTDVQIGRVIDYLEESGQLENTLIFYCADNGASGEGSPDVGQREPLLQRLPGRHRVQPGDARQARIAGHLQPLSDRLGGRVQHTVPDVQALLAVRRRHRGSHGHPLAEGHQGSRRAPSSVPSLHRHRPDDPGVLWADDAGCRRWCEAGAALRCLDALQLRRRQRADAEGDAVLRDAEHAWDLAQRLEGSDRARPDDQHRKVRPGPLAAVQHRCRSCGSHRPRRQASRQGEGAGSPLARGGQEKQRAAAQRLRHRRHPRARIQGRGAGQRAVRLLPGNDGDP